MARKKIEQDLKKIKPVEISRGKKEEKAEEKKEDKSKQNFEHEQFQDSSVWQSSGFTPERTAGKARVENLEEFAEQLPKQEASPQVAYSSKPSDSSYASSYLSGKKSYQEKEIEMRPAPVLSSGRQIRNFAPEPQRAASQDFSRQAEEFERAQQQYQLEMQEKSKLPFQRGKRKTEIF